VIKRFLPRSLLGRSLLIIITPLVLLQLAAGIVFFESHWDKVSLRLARSVAGDVATLVDLLREDASPGNRYRVFGMAAQHLGLTAALKPGKILANVPQRSGGRDDDALIRALGEAVDKPIHVDTTSLKRHVLVQVQLSQGVLEVIMSRKRLFSSTTYVFVLWMVGVSMILFGVAFVFMRNQVKPIRRLAAAADSFGMGRDVTAFKIEGAAEVRQAASAFLVMRERILRQISDRTQMLAGVSHDLRTPLTRMKLQLALLGDAEGSNELKSDVEEMEHMLEVYLAFARGEGAEAPEPHDVAALLEDVVGQARRNGGQVDLHCEGAITVPLRANAFKRCMTNLIDNAIRYAGHVSVRAGLRGDHMEVTVDDDGPGIPEDKRDQAFESFFRVEESRNPDTGGVGLGLTIARDVVRSHGGSITLEDAPMGGLRARLRLPV